MLKSSKTSPHHSVKLFHCNYSGYFMHCRIYNVDISKRVLASLGGDAEGALTAANLHESYFNLVSLKFVTSLRNSTKVK